MACPVSSDVGVSVAGTRMAGLGRRGGRRSVRGGGGRRRSLGDGCGGEPSGATGVGAPGACAAVDGGGAAVAPQDAWQPPCPEVGWLGFGRARMRLECVRVSGFCAIRFATWNCGSCVPDGRLHEIRAWMESVSCHVLAVQETRVVDADGLTRAWRAEWPGSAAVVAPAEPHRSGTALLLCPEAALHKGKSFSHGSALAACVLQYDGVTLCLASLYAPQQGLPARAASAEALASASEVWLRGAIQRAPGQRNVPLVCVLGDYNECLRGPSDRFQSAAGDGAGDGMGVALPSDDSTMLSWASAMGLRDVYGREHPVGDGSPGYTFLCSRTDGSSSASRLDYAMANEECLRAVVGCAVDYSQGARVAYRHYPLIVAVRVRVTAHVSAAGVRALAPRVRVALLKDLRDDEAREHSLARLRRSVEKINADLDTNDLDAAAVKVVGAFAQAMRPEAGGVRLVRDISLHDHASLPRSLARAIRGAEVVLKDAAVSQTPEIRLRWWRCLASCGRRAHLPHAPSVPCDVVVWSQWQALAVAALDGWRAALWSAARADRKRRIRRGLVRRLCNFARAEELARFVRQTTVSGDHTAGELVASVEVNGPDGRLLLSEPHAVAAAARVVFESWVPIRDAPWCTDGMSWFWTHVYKVLLRAKALSIEASNALTAPISEVEFTSVLKATSKSSSPGVSGTAYKHLKQLVPGHPFLLALLRMLNLCIAQERVPPVFRRGLLRPIPKSDGSADLAKSRPITLLEAPLKILTRVLSRRLEVALTITGLLPGGNFAFGRGLSTTDPLIAMRTLLERARDAKLPFAIALIDVTKAYDSICFPSLRHTLDILNVSAAFTNLFASLYADLTSQVITAYGLSEPFMVRRGVAQGECSSPLLFLIFMAPMLLALRETTEAPQGRGVGFTISAGRRGVSKVVVSNTAFADDLALFSTTALGLQVLCDVVSKFLAMHGLEVSVKKTLILDGLDPARRRRRGRHKQYPCNEELAALRVGGACLPEANIISDPDGMFRYLGVCFCASLSVQPQLTVLRERLFRDCAVLGRRALTAPMLRYLVTSVLWPRLIYALALHPVTPKQLAWLEAPALQWARRALRLPSSFPTAPVLSAATLGLVGLQACWEEHVIAEAEVLLNGVGLGADCLRARLSQWQEESGVRCVLRCPEEVRVPKTWLAGVASAAWRLGMGFAQHGDDVLEIERWLSPRQRFVFGRQLRDAGMKRVSQIARFVDGSWRYAEPFFLGLGRTLSCVLREALADARRVLLPSVAAALDGEHGVGDMPAWPQSTGEALESWASRLQCDGGGAGLRMWGDASCVPATEESSVVMSVALVVESGASFI